MRRRTPSPELHDWISVVVDENAADLLRYLRRRVEQPEDAADLLGRVMIALWENGAKVPDSATEARMWSFGIARNLVREHHRHSAKAMALAADLRDHLRNSGQPTNAADVAAEANLREIEVRTAVRTLDVRSRELVMLVHWDGFSIAEAARLLSMNESTARTRHGRALRRLERMLQDGQDDNAGDRERAPSGLTAGAPQRASEPSSA